MSGTGVVLMNLGGPDSAGAVEPFLFNLFYDSAIIQLPNPFRWLIAKLIARRRGRVARQIFAKIGNVSPLLQNTQAQAAALERVLGQGFRVAIAMRYWAPRASEAAAALKAWEVERVILLPLYPQFSSTTTASSITDWDHAARKIGLGVPTRAICCYPAEAGFVAAVASAIDRAIAAWPAEIALPRLLLSAHGLPQRVVARGDPYQSQVEQTARAIHAALSSRNIEAVVCYQSRVGPLKWLMPATDAEIRRAGEDGRGVIVAPIAFVSEHSETLVELDIEYRHLAAASGVPRYVRVATVGAAESFVAGLAALVRAACATMDAAPYPEGGRSHCEDRFGLCARREVT
ncbi:MAG TPA: ferrochelatase [Stellaceae bacterium]|nr:ferrochelatase [Stellaceae bacterium]